MAENKPLVNFERVQIIVDTMAACLADFDISYQDFVEGDSLAINKWRVQLESYINESRDRIEKMKEAHDEAGG